MKILPSSAPYNTLPPRFTGVRPRTSSQATTPADQAEIRFSGLPHYFQAHHKLHARIDRFLRQYHPAFAQKKADKSASWHLSKLAETQTPKLSSNERALHDFALRVAVGENIQAQGSEETDHKKEAADPSVAQARLETLLKQNGIDLNTDELLSALDCNIKALEAKMQGIAERTKPHQDWKTTLKASTVRHDKRGYQRRAQISLLKAHTFYAQESLLTLPKASLFRYITSSPPQDETTAADYRMQELTIRLYPKADKWLRNRDYRTQVVGHEYGHHIQLWRQEEAFWDRIRLAEKLSRLPDPDSKRDWETLFQLRSLQEMPNVIDDIFVEGWATYCEYLMVENGFFTAPEQQLLSLKRLLSQLKSTQYAVELQSGKISVEEFRKQHPRIKKSFIDYMKQPDILPMAYGLGMLQIMQLRALVQQQDPGISLKTFHDRLLSTPVMPLPAMTRWEFDLDLPPLSAETPVIP
jgi:hypothetical protein